jgi:hypothetical protein
MTKYDSGIALRMSPETIQPFSGLAHQFNQYRLLPWRCTFTEIHILANLTKIRKTDGIAAYNLGIGKKIA